MTDEQARIIQAMRDGRERTQDDISNKTGIDSGKLPDALNGLTERGWLACDAQNSARISIYKFARASMRAPE